MTYLMYQLIVAFRSVGSSQNIGIVCTYLPYSTHLRIYAASYIQ